MNPDKYALAQSTYKYLLERRAQQEQRARLHKAAVARRKKRKNGGHK